MSEGRKRTPMPIREVEERARGSGPVKSYFLSPEELDHYNKTGKVLREEISMNQLTKERYLQLRLQGVGRSEIMKNHFSSSVVFYKHLKEWGIKEKDAEDRELDLMQPQPDPPLPSESKTTTAEAEGPTPKTVPNQEVPRVELPAQVNSLAAQLEQMLKSFGISGPIQDVIAERRRQDAKWGQQDHEPQLWTGILGEEFGELCEAINETVFDNGAEAKRKGGYENMRREAIQVAAVAVSFIEALDRRYG